MSRLLGVQTSCAREHSKLGRDSKRPLGTSHGPLKGRERSSKKRSKTLWVRAGVLMSYDGVHVRAARLQSLGVVESRAEIGDVEGDAMLTNSILPRAISMRFERREMAPMAVRPVTSVGVFALSCAIAPQCQWCGLAAQCGGCGIAEKARSTSCAFPRPPPFFYSLSRRVRSSGNGRPDGRGTGRESHMGKAKRSNGRRQVVRDGFTGRPRPRPETGPNAERLHTRT